jgi:hypothetical protein
MWMRSGPLMVLHPKGHITLMHVLARHVLVLSIKMNIRIWASFITVIHSIIVDIINKIFFT